MPAPLLLQFIPGKNLGLTSASHRDRQLSQTLILHTGFLGLTFSDAKSQNSSSLQQQPQCSRAHTEGEASTTPRSCEHTNSDKFSLSQLTGLQTVRVKFCPGLGTPRASIGSWTVVPSGGSGSPLPSPKISLGFQFFESRLNLKLEESTSTTNPLLTDYKLSTTHTDTKKKSLFYSQCKTQLLLSNSGTMKVTEKGCFLYVRNDTQGLTSA